ncbi:hypothetical protein FF38_01336 [Lucilia cuprina]|uniref:Uncharacterized protein n=1 Tax=Lucilia cuprina TaxID=7375 RepID=A0A0L0BTK2_LUCCU|nr:hypothetical protein FF38_01336 [Lucilia cuprina]
MGDVIIWENSQPFSTRFCRPIKLIFGKETSELEKLNFVAILTGVNVGLTAGLVYIDVTWVRQQVYWVLDVFKYLLAYCLKFWTCG